MDFIVDQKNTRPNQLNCLLEKAKQENYTNLYINYEHLEEIPANVLEISSIQGLFLKHNLLKSLPPDLWKLSLLKTLYLPSNQLTNLPEEIAKCQNLESLNVDNNFLKSLPKSIGELTKLKTLQVSNNELEVIPAEIGQLRLLEVLELTHNRIQYLPDELSKCANLRRISVGANLIEEFPRVLLELVDLHDLSLSGNFISHLSPDWSRLSDLNTLDLDNNQDISVIPASVLEMPALQILGIHGCGSNVLGLEKTEILEQYIKVEGMKNVQGNVEPLLELCLRLAPDTNQQDLLPKGFQEMLKTPKGCCHSCHQPYYVNAFFQLCNMNETSTLTPMKVRLYEQIIHTKCYFIYCFCSYKCLERYHHRFEGYQRK